MGGKICNKTGTQVELSSLEAEPVRAPSLQAQPEHLRDVLSQNKT